MAENANYFEDGHPASIDFYVVSLPGERIDDGQVFQFQAFDQKEGLGGDRLQTILEVVKLALDNRFVKCGDLSIEVLRCILFPFDHIDKVLRLTHIRMTICRCVFGHCTR